MAHFFLTIFFLLAAPIIQASHFSVPEERLHHIHDAIFDSLVPFSDDELNTTIAHILSEAKQNSFAKAMAVPSLRGAFFLLDNLHLSYKKQFLKSYFRLVGKDKNTGRKLTEESLRSYRRFITNLGRSKVRLSIVDLTTFEKLMLFSALIDSDANVLSLIGSQIRSFYMQVMYEGPLGEKISGDSNREPRVASSIPTLPTFTTHLSYKPKMRRIKGGLDAIIIGSGAAGSVAANQLQKNGLKVLVIEAGPMVIPGAMDTTSDFRFIEGNSERLSEDGSIALINGESVGGGTAVSFDTAQRLTRTHLRHRFHRWHDEGIIPIELWNDEQIDGAAQWVKDEFSSRRVTKEEINENNRILIRGARSLGIPYRRYEVISHKPDESPHEVSNKKSSFEYLLLPAMKAATTPVTLLSDCRVKRVIMRSGRAVGVECIYQPKQFGLGIVHDLYGFDIKPNTEITIYADNIILAAGSIGTSTILTSSEIDNKNIGKGFVANPFITLLAKFDQAVNADSGAQSTVLIDSFMPTDKHPTRPGFIVDTGLGRLSNWALLVPGMPVQVKKMFSQIANLGIFSVMLADTPHDGNRIVVDGKGNLKVHYELLEEDRRNLIFGIKTAIKILFAAGAQEISFNSFEYPLFQEGGIYSNTLTPDMDINHLFTRFHVERNKTPLQSAHMMGGNRIGVDPKTSVVDSDYQVWNAKGLYVIDGSIFPGSIGANSMNTIYAVAKIFSDLFVANFKQAQEKFLPHR